MLKFILHANIDKDKWDNCLKKIDRAHFYGLYGYLSAICQWNALVLEENNEYTVLVPLPFNEKFGIRFLYQPFFCQQLGVFVDRNLTPQETKQIVGLIKKNHLFGKLQWANKLGFEYNFSLLEKANFELPLNNSFEQLSSSFNQNRKRNLKKLHELDALTVHQVSDLDAITRCVDSFQKQMQDKIIGVRQEHYHNFLEGNRSVLKQVTPTVVQIYSKQELVSESYFIEFNNRVIYLMGYTVANYLKLSVSSLAFEKIIKNYANSNKILDFEGGSIPGIAQFYLSFGAQKKEYYVFSLRPIFIAVKKIFKFV